MHQSALALLDLVEEQRTVADSEQPAQPDQTANHSRWPPPERVPTTTLGDLLANRWQTAVRVAPGMCQAGHRTRPELLVWCGAPRRNRTGDPILTMDALYRLS
jgi:hypothetical protein